MYVVSYMHSNKLKADNDANEAARMESKLLAVNETKLHHKVTLTSKSTRVLANMHCRYDIDNDYFYSLHSFR